MSTSTLQPDDEEVRTVMTKTSFLSPSALRRFVSTRYMTSSEFSPYRAMTRSPG